MPCQGGCTLTIGYWKTHAGFGPQTDVVTPLLPVYLGTQGGTLTVTVSTAAQAVSILNFGGSNGVINASNGINRLYAQLLAAKLNIKNGASSSAISATIASADNFLATHNSTSWNSLSRADRNLVNSLQATLESYNTGAIGPGHCSEASNTSVLLAASADSTDTEDCECIEEQVYQEETPWKVGCSGTDTQYADSQSVYQPEYCPHKRTKCGWCKCDFLY